MNERERLKLYDRLGEVLGLDEAGTLMELLPPNGWDDIATKDLVAANATSLRGEMAEVRGEMAEVRGEMAEVRGEMAELRSEMAAQFAGVATQFASVANEFSAVRSEMATGFATVQRNMLIAMAGFMLTIWITLLFV